MFLFLSVLILSLVWVMYSGVFRANQYDMRIQYDQKKNLYQVRLVVDHPQEEAIILRTDQPSALSLETVEGVVSDDFEFSSIESKEGGVKVRVRASEKRREIRFSIPKIKDVPIKKMVLLRKGRKVNQETVLNLVGLPEKEDKEKQFLTFSTKELRTQRLANAGDTRSVSSVQNFQELKRAIEQNIDTIELKADIKATAVLTIPNRKITINGNGYTYFVVGNHSGMNLQDGTSESVFEMKNVSVSHSSARNAFISGGKGRIIRLEDMQNSENSARKAGFFIDSWYAKLELRGNVTWLSEKNGSKISQLIRILGVYITDKAVVQLTSSYCLFRMYPGGASYQTYFIVDKQATVKLHSENEQVVYMNIEGSRNDVRFQVKDSGTKVEASSSGKLIGAPGGTVALVGSAKSTDSGVLIEGGAELQIVNKAAVSNDSPKVMSAMVQQVEGALFQARGKGTKVVLYAEGESHSYQAVLRYRLVGNQKMIVSDSAEVVIRKKTGVAAAVRMYGKNNQFLCKNGGKIYIFNEGTAGSASDGGDTSGRQAIQFTLDAGGESSFQIEGEGSECLLRAAKGPAISCFAGNFSLKMKGKGSFRVEGQTKSQDVGIVQVSGASTSVELENPLLYDFCNTRPYGGQVFNASRQTFFSSVGASLSVWEINNKVDVNRDPDENWWKLDYRLSGRDFRDIQYSSMPSLFNATTYKGAQKYTRMRGDNFQAVVDELRVPTNADKKIYGHVSIPLSVGMDDKRDAWEKEVGVLVEVKDRNGTRIDYRWAYTKGYNNQYPGVSQYGEERRGGIFVLELERFLPSGATVEVVQAFRGEGNPNDSRNLYSDPDKLKIDSRKVQDVRPPTGLEIAQKRITNTMKMISGTLNIYDSVDQKIQEKATVYLKTKKGYLKDSQGQLVKAEVSPTSESKNQQSIHEKKWEIYLPRYLELDDQYLEITTKEPAQFSQNLQGVWPITLEQEPDEVLGNLMPSALSYGTYKGYHDAVGNERFESSQLFTIENVVPSQPNFVFSIANQQASPNGEYRLKKGQQFDFKLTIKSLDSPTSGKGAIGNIRYEVKLPANLEYEDFAKLLGNPYVESYQYNEMERNLELKMKRNLYTGESVNLLLSARVPAQFAQSQFSSYAYVSADYPRENPFVMGPEDPTHPREKYTDKDSLSVTVADGILEGKGVYLTVKNKRLLIYYSKVEEFDVYIGKEFYKKYSVTETDEFQSVTLEIPVHDIRSTVKVVYLTPTGEKRQVTWNKQWQ